LEKILVGTYHLMSISHNPRKNPRINDFSPKVWSQQGPGSKKRLFLPELFRIKSRTALGVV